MATKNKFEFDKVIKKLKQAKVNVPVRIANVARKYFVNTFQVSGFDKKKWEEVDRRIPGTSAYKYPQKPKASSRTSPILVRTGKLRREVNNSIRSTTWNEIKLGVSDATPYAQYLNEGTDKMEQREFMGNSKELNDLIKNELKTQIKKIF